VTQDGRIWWWGYLHSNGSLHVKRYFSREDIDEAVESPFVWATFGPWPCEDREDAILKCKNEASRHAL